MRYTIGEKSYSGPLLQKVRQTPFKGGCHCGVLQLRRESGLNSEYSKENWGVTATEQDGVLVDGELLKGRVVLR